MTDFEHAQDQEHRGSAPWDALLQQLYRVIAEEGDGRCLAWISPANGDFELDTEESVHERIVVPINHPFFDRRFSPYLVELDLSKFRDDEYFRASVALAWRTWNVPLLAAQRGQPVCGWIIANGSAKQIANHWGQRCHLHPVDRRTRLLRFQDPGVREMLWDDLTPEQRLLLLGPSKVLLGMDRHRRLMRQEAPALVAVAEPGTPSAASYRLMLRREQWERVADYAVLHAAWVHGLGHGMIQRERHIDAPVRSSLRTAAASYGLVSDGDRMLFALLALRLGETFHTHPRLAPVWKLTASGDTFAESFEKTSGVPVEQLSAYLAKN